MAAHKKVLYRADREVNRDPLDGKHPVYDFHNRVTDFRNQASHFYVCYYHVTDFHVFHNRVADFMIFTIKSQIFCFSHFFHIAGSYREGSRVHTRLPLIVALPPILTSLRIISS